MTKNPCLSVVLNTKNSAKYLRECLGSVAPIADEIVIVDMASQDQTAAIAKQFAAKFYQYPHPDIGFADPAREFAFSKASGEWIFMIDSDEQIKKELATLIRQVATNSPHQLPIAEAYFIARTNIIFDKPIQKVGWYPDYQMRLWRSGAIKWQPQVHSVPKIIGKSAYFPSSEELSIVHHNYQFVSQFIQRADKYSNFAAEQISKQKNHTVTPTDLFASFFDEFWRRGFADEGLLEGNHGVALTILQAHYQFLTQAKVWQKQGFNWQNLSNKQLKKLRQNFFHQAHYWWADLMIKKTTGLGKLYYRLRRKLKI